MAFLETRGDYQFADRLVAALRDVSSELKRANELKEAEFKAAGIIKEKTDSSSLPQTVIR